MKIILGGDDLQHSLRERKIILGEDHLQHSWWERKIILCGKKILCENERFGDDDLQQQHSLRERKIWRRRFTSFFARTKDLATTIYIVLCENERLGDDDLQHSLRERKIILGEDHLQHSLRERKIWRRRFAVFFGQKNIPLPSFTHSTRRKKC